MGFCHLMQSQLHAGAQVRHPYFSQLLDVWKKIQFLHNSAVMDKLMSSYFLTAESRRVDDFAATYLVTFVHACSLLKTYHIVECLPQRPLPSRNNLLQSHER